MNAEWFILTERFGSAVLLGSAIGLNRKLHGKPVGIRTHALVALGSATFTYVSMGGVGLLDNGGPGLRTVQGIVTGIGFVGAGVILHRSGSKNRITGLTTASALWFTAALGVACGAGLFVPAFVATILALIVLIIGGPLEGYIEDYCTPKPRPPSGDILAPTSIILNEGQGNGRQEAARAGEEERSQVSAQKAGAHAEV